jgi:Mrp family chromosome partitioning ATPase
MVDLTHEMAGLYQALHPRPAGGRVIAFVSALDGEGTSTVAREYARCEAAMASGAVWLIDADLRAQSQLTTVMGDQARFGPRGPLSQATPDGSAFFSLNPPQRDDLGHAVPDADYLVARPFLGNKLWVTQVRTDVVEPLQRLSLKDNTSYFKALRQHATCVIIDTPALSRSTDALGLAAEADGVVLVVSEDRGTLQVRHDACAALEAAGARLLGMVYNRAEGVRRSEAV